MNKDLFEEIGNHPNESSLCPDEGI